MKWTSDHHAVREALQSIAVVTHRIDEGGTRDTLTFDLPNGDVVQIIGSPLTLRLLPGREGHWRRREGTLP